MSRHRSGADHATARVALVPRTFAGLRRFWAERSLLGAALLLALFVLAYLWPVLLGGKMLGPLADLYRLAPWSRLAPPDLAEYTNSALWDVPSADYPWRFLARTLIREGVFPAWNPHVLTGIPFFANPQTMMLSPFSIPLWVLPLEYGVGLSAALMLWTAAFGTFLLVREVGLRFLPGLLAGVAYALCSYHVVWLTHGSLPAVSALLPWILWLSERVLRRGTMAPALGLAFATAFALTGGHPGTQVHVLGAAGLFVLLRAASASELTRAERARRGGLAVGGIAAGVLLVAVMFLPELLSSRGTLGTQVRHGGGGGLPGAQMPFSAIVSTLFPDWWGRPSGLSVFGPSIPLPSGLAQEVSFNERTFFAGVVPLLMAVVALLASSRWRAKLPFVVLGVVALAVPLHGPGVYWLVEHLPGFELVQNQRMHFVFELAVAVLAAFGLDAILDEGRSRGRMLVAPLLGLVAVVVAVVVLKPSANDVDQVVRHFAQGVDVVNVKALPLTSVAWFALLSLAVALLLAAVWRRPRWAAAAAVALVLLAALDMLRFADGYQPMGQPAKVVPPVTPAIQYLMRHADDGRIAAIGTALPNDWTLVYGLRDVRGYDPPYPSRAFYELWLLGNPEQGNWQSFYVRNLDPSSMQVLDLLGARYVAADPGEWGYAAVRAGMRIAHRGYDADVFINPHAAPRVVVARQVRFADDEAEARSLLFEPGFDARHSAVVERASIDAVDRGVRSGGGSASVVRDKNAEVVVRTDLKRRSLVVLNDGWSDGWRVSVDGEPAPAVRVDTVMRGVVVDSGEHVVTWRYTVPGIRLGAAISVATLIGLAAVAVALRLRGRRIRSRPRERDAVAT